MAGLDRARDALTVIAHDGYREGEVPAYRDCPECGMPVRADRTDLISEHNRVCQSPLSARELEVLQLVADGLTYAEIARALFLSIETVRSHMKNVLGKFGVANRAGAVGVGFRQGLLR